MDDYKAGHIYFASESVGEGHPDKLCDQVSDGILDACLAVDPNAKVAMETATKTKLVSRHFQGAYCAFSRKCATQTPLSIQTKADRDRDK